MKPVHVKSRKYIDFGIKNNDKDPKCEGAHHVRILKYKKICGKGYSRNWTKDVSVIKKVKNTVLSTYVISDLNGEEIVVMFYEKELQKANQTEFRIEKVIKRKDDKFS